MISTTQFVAEWVNGFMNARGFVGCVDPHELTPEKIVVGLDEEALDDIRVALVALRNDHRARRGHALAWELVSAIETNERRIRAQNFKGLIKRRPMRRANYERMAA